MDKQTSLSGKLAIIRAKIKNQSLTPSAMRIQPHTKNLTDAEKALFLEYLEEKLTRITPFIKAHYPDPDTVKLDVRMEKYDKHTAFEFKYELQLPKKRLLASKTKHGIKEGMDLATDKLEGSLRKHFKKLTRE